MKPVSSESRRWISAGLRPFRSFAPSVAVLPAPDLAEDVQLHVAALSRQGGHREVTNLLRSWTDLVFASAVQGVDLIRDHSRIFGPWDRMTMWNSLSAPAS